MMHDHNVNGIGKPKKLGPTAYNGASTKAETESASEGKN